MAEKTRIYVGRVNEPPEPIVGEATEPTVVGESKPDEREEDNGEEQS